MKRLPYEFVAAHAARLFDQVATAPDWEAMFYLEQYYIFIFTCGWTDQELDQEMLRRIDAAWDAIIRNQSKVRRLKSVLH